MTDASTTPPTARPVGARLPLIGGLLAHLPALIALTCGSVNSYRRLAPQSWSSAFTCWGTTTGRRRYGCRRAGALTRPSTNLELKPSDSTGQPLPGARRGHPRRPRRHPQQARPGPAGRHRPGTPVEGDPAARGIERLPSLAGRGAGRPGGRRAAHGGARPPAAGRLPGREALGGGRRSAPGTPPSSASTTCASSSGPGGRPPPARPLDLADPQRPEVEDARGQHRVGARLDGRAGSPRAGPRRRRRSPGPDRRPDRRIISRSKPSLVPSRVHRVEQDLARAQLGGPVRPLDGVDAGAACGRRGW